ncbi:MAG: AMP-dependent synthetase/ligase [Solirubrobacterales bacterium]
MENVTKGDPLTTTATAATKSNTLADLLKASAAEHPNADVFMFKTEAGTWQTATFSDALTRVENLALGLMDWGVQRGDRVAILGNTRPEWTIADLGAMSAGATVVPIYQTNSPAECQYVLEHSGSRVVIVEDDTQLAKIREIRDSLPELELIVMMIGSAEDATAMEELERKGADGDRAALEQRISEVTPDDFCKIVYTSGTTGPPKGCLISHGNYRAMLDMADEVDILGPGEKTYIYLPLAHVFALLLQYGVIDVGGCLAYWERDATKIIPNLAEVRPENFPSVPRIFEKVHDIAKASGAEGGLKGAIFNWAIGVGTEYNEAIEAGREPGALTKLKHGIADKLVLSKVRDIFGGNVELALTGAAPIDPEIITFFHAAGVPVYEAWGMTETSTGGTTNLPGKSKVGTVGRALPGVELKLSDEGELLVKGPNVFKGYYKNEEATRETIRDGWLHTGDIATIDGDGFVSITGRIKEIIITAGGKNITPVNIEAQVKRHPLVAQCVVIGDKRPYLVALVTIDPEAAVSYAEENGKDPAELYRDPEVVASIEAHVDQVNGDLAPVQQIKKIKILPEDLTQEAGELTPTLKLKRPVIAEIHSAEIEELYAN